jgi:hypothetical protein
MVAKQQVAGFLARVCPADLGITVADEVLADGRIVFGVDCAFPNGRQSLNTSSRGSKPER